MPTGHVPSCTKHHPVNLNQGEGIFTEHHTRQWHYFTPITRGQVHPSIDYPEEDHQFQGLSQSLPPFSSKSHNLSCTPMITQPPFHSRGARKISTLPDPCPKNGVQSQIIRSQPGSHHMASHQASPLLFFSASHIAHRDWINSSSFFSFHCSPSPMI